MTAGERLAEALSELEDPAELQALIVEAGRIKDRLDTLDALAGGDTGVWLQLTELRDSGGDLKVVVDQPLQEARQLATVFRQMLAEIARRRQAMGVTDGDDVLDSL